ncbi:MAG: MerR family transcriptional regulator [Solirubrobacteraceae bacterium]|nr:MAG: MerR family transcriptional regulator [Solirubrobacterales bacterium]
MASNEHDELTIDQLAQRTGMTARNIRAHQSRGLLPAPAVRGRTGYYGPDHLARVELIKELQADGLNLDLIRRLLDGAGGSSGEVLRFTRALREPFGDEQPELVDVSELARRWQTTDGRLLAKAVDLGLLRSLGDGRYEEVSPRLVSAGEELGRLGVTLDTALEVMARLRHHADRVANLFVELFIDSVWKPFEAEGRPEERWVEVRGTLERLRPLATESLLAVFQLAMSDAIDHAFGRELRRVLRPHSDGSKRRGRRR